MSSVRMCDECGFIFSENSEGWGNGTVTKMSRDAETGKIKPTQISVDYCPTCVEAKETPGAGNNPVPPTVNERRQIRPPAAVDEFLDDPSKGVRRTRPES